MKISLLIFGLFLLLLPGNIFSQESSIDELLSLYRANAQNEERMEELLRQDPELRSKLQGFINHEMNFAPMDSTVASHQQELLNEGMFKLQFEVLKGILSNENIGGIEQMYWKVIESDYSKEIGDILLIHLQRSKEKLKNTINSNFK